MPNIYPSLEDFKCDILERSKHLNPLASNIGTHLRGINGQPIRTTTNYMTNGTGKYAPASNNTTMIGQQQQIYPSFNNNQQQYSLHLGASIDDSQSSSSSSIYPSLSKAVMVAPWSGYSQAHKQLQPTNAIRPVIVCKDSSGKVGLRVGAVQGGIFVVLVHASSPAAMAGLKFGDQLLEVNDIPVAGYSMSKVHDIIKKSSPDELRFAIRDRPFARSVMLYKDNHGLVGFMFNKHGKIVSINKDSSAARNGLLIDHNMIEINAQNVVGLDETEIRSILDECGNVVILTVLPSKIFEQMIEHTDAKLIRNSMDHSAPE